MCHTVKPIGHARPRAPSRHENDVSQAGIRQRRMVLAASRMMSRGQGRLWYRRGTLHGPGRGRLAATLLTITVLLTLAAFACGPAEPLPRATTAPAPGTMGAPANAWDELVKAAQREGTVNVYGTSLSGVAVPLRDAFRQKYGINLEFIQGRPPEVIARFSAERRAGLFLADVGHLGETTHTMDIKPLGVTVPLTNLLVLPEVTNPSNWITGKLPYVDRDQHILMFMSLASPSVMVNTDMVKEGEITSFMDVLKPQWKKKIILSDPTVSGPSPNTLATLVRVLGREKALDVFRQLAAQEPVISRDTRLIQEWVARGRYPVSIGASQTVYSEFKAAGAPVQFLILKEPRFTSGGPGNISVFSNNPHPKAAQLYINWLLSKEGSTIWSKGTGYPAGRVDISKEGLDPSFVPRGDEVFPDEELLNLRVEMRKIAAEIFGPLMK